jgi:putative ABC transport system substrate-binding protein
MLRPALGGQNMQRRKFLGVIGGAATAWPHWALAQAIKRKALIGWHAGGSQPAVSGFIRAFLDGMRELGYAEGRDFDMAYRFADGYADRLQGLASELAQLKPDIIVAAASANAVAVKSVTTTIPIVVPALADAVALGLIASEARPGGNITGTMPYVKGLPGKQLELAREIVPGTGRIGLLDDPTDVKAIPQRQEIEAIAPKLGIEVVVAAVRASEHIGSAYQELAARQVGVVIVEQTNMLLNARKTIAEAAAANNLPSVYGYREHVEAGGLISYGVDLRWCFHRAALYVDKILKGTKPGELPVEFPTTLQLIVNLKTAKALGLTVTPALIARTDDVIE